MPDELTVDYLSVLDQTSLGMRWIISQFGEAAVPSVAWRKFTTLRGYGYLHKCTCEHVHEN